ncbi:hypothetical protein MTO96_016917 [Rhipicephalus appendiculatus]
MVHNASSFQGIRHQAVAIPRGAGALHIRSVAVRAAVFPVTVFLHVHGRAAPVLPGHAVSPLTNLLELWEGPAVSPLANLLELRRGLRCRLWRICWS